MIRMDESYKFKKVISIGIVSELTGLSYRQIRYYEEKNLIFPERSEKGTRKYSFIDIEALIDIAGYVEEGVRTLDIKRKLSKQKKEKKMFNELRKGQINAYFGLR